MTDHLLKDGMVIFEFEGSKEVRVALGRRHLGPCLSDRNPGWVELPCARNKFEQEGDTKHTSPAWAASSLFVEGSEENGGRPVAFGRREQVERLGVKIDDTVVLSGQFNELLMGVLFRGKSDEWKSEQRE